MSNHQHQQLVYDSHTHLNDDAFYDDVPAFINRAAHYGVTEMNIIGSNQLLNTRALKLGHQYDNLHPIIGWHPEDIANWNSETKKELRQQLADPLVVGIGEIGLDYYNDEHSPHKQQQEIFAEQLEWARELKLPEWAEKFMDLGMMISFSGVVSFKNATEVHEAALVVPLEKMMVETDAPYLTPLPYRGKQNEPGFTKFTVDAIADLKQVDAGKVAYKTFTNARRLFLENEERGL